MKPADLADEQLVVEVRSTNKELYSELIRRYQKKMEHYIAKFIRHPDELEDVLQSVFIKAYQNLNGFDTEKKFSPWLYRIAHNEALNYIRKYGKIQVPVEDVEHLLVDDRIDLPKEIDRGMLKEKMELALTKLKPAYRETLILYFFEQKSYEEISDILRVPTSTVGTLLLRGKKQLKNHLDKTLYVGQ